MKKQNSTGLKVLEGTIIVIVFLAGLLATKISDLANPQGSTLWEVLPFLVALALCSIRLLPIWIAPKYNLQIDEECLTLMKRKKQIVRQYAWSDIIGLTLGASRETGGYIKIVLFVKLKDDAEILELCELPFSIFFFRAHEYNFYKFMYYFGSVKAMQEKVDKELLRESCFAIGIEPPE